MDTGAPAHLRTNVAVLCCKGAFQNYLVQRVAEEFRLVGVVHHAAKSPKGSWRDRIAKYRSPRLLFEYLAARVLLPRQTRRARALERELMWTAGSAPEVPAGTPTIEVDDINSPRVRESLLQWKPDLVLVNGTNLLRKDLLSLAPGTRWGFVNLHTGLSPYSRGGNCNLFMLFEGKPEYVGITIHYLDSGIDSGDIILSSQVPMDLDDSFEMIEVREFHHGIEALIRAAKALVAGSAPRVRQWEEGKLFLKRTGYVYRPFHRVLINRAIRRGLLRDYQADKPRRDSSVRLIDCGEGDRSEALR